jgi:hypothetical protein
LGKIYYPGKNGLIESFLTVDEKGAVHEILTSYDGNGNPVDEVEIGLLVPYSSEKEHAVLLVHKLSGFEITLVKSSGKRNG